MKVILSQIDKMTIKEVFTRKEVVTPVQTGVHCLELSAAMDSGWSSPRASSRGRNDKFVRRNDEESNCFDLSYFWQISWDQACDFDSALLHARSWP